MVRGRIKFIGQVVLDLSLLALAYVLAHGLRYDFSLPLLQIKRLAFQLPYVVALEYGLMVAFSAQRVAWRFVSAADVLTLARPLLLATFVLTAVRWVAPSLPFAHRIYLVIPYGAIAINLALATGGVLGVRLGRRLLAEKSERQNHAVPAGAGKRILLVGAGESGVRVAKEVTRRRDLGLVLVGFVDDDPFKQKARLGGYPVLGTIGELPRLLKTRTVDEVVITITKISSPLIRQIVSHAEEAKAPVKIIPGLHEIIGGQVSVTRLREVRIEDLLGRDPVALDTEGVSAFIRAKVVAVSGAGGSIGSELCRQILAYAPAKLLLLERAENALFEVHSELRQRFPAGALVPCLADITDAERVRSVITAHGCDVIFHAAAHKHVPMLEWNPSEAISNNVLGTKIMADVAAERGVAHFVLISTDKAINPSSVMGASKRVAELYVQAMGRKHQSCRFVAVRFGNVLDSAGSVVPIFRRQIAAGGPVTVTHPDMRRYFMTLSEASQLVLQAGALGKGGEVFVLDMGEPVKIVDLAHDLIRMSGLQPDEDIKIEFCGVRPGEKLFEELCTDDEHTQRTGHHKIFVGQVRETDWETLERALAGLGVAHSQSKPEEIYANLRALIPEFTGEYKRSPASVEAKANTPPMISPYAEQPLDERLPSQHSETQNH